MAIERRTAVYFLIQCDECANSFESDFDERMEDVMALARSQGWVVSQFPGQTLCPATLLRRREEPERGVRVDPVVAERD